MDEKTYISRGHRYVITGDSISMIKPIFRTGNSLVIAITDAAKLMGWQKGDVVEFTLKRVAHGENCKINED